MITKSLIQQLPKAELHCHLDGSLRVDTIFELAEEYDISLPTHDKAALTEIVTMDLDCDSLATYLRAFDVTLMVMQHQKAIERVAFEVAEDAARDNIRYLEIRFAPILHQANGLQLVDIVEAVLRGLQRAEKQYSIKAAVIICGLRHMQPASTEELADLTIAFKNKGVVGFDLAGAELDYPAKKHLQAFYRILNNNINITIHAGEAYGSKSIAQALHYCGAHRLGHGTRLHEDADLMHYVNDHRIPLEVCLTSNIQTKAAESFELHPAKFYHELGLRVTLNTDNTLVSGVTLSDEYYLAATTYHWGIDDIKKIILNGFKSGFLPAREKRELLTAVSAELSAVTLNS